MKSLALAATAASLTVISLVGAPQPPPAVEFVTHVIEPKFPGGYAVLAVDVNKDGKLDVMVSVSVCRSWRGTRTRRGSAM